MPDATGKICAWIRRIAAYERVTTALLTWGDQWAPTPGGPPLLLVHDTCGNITAPVLTCPHCHAEVSAANTHGQPGPGSTQPAVAGAAQ